ncbi:hypothetical protein JQK62_21305, partial [Leptospira santarosai]|nr:hypothetical protein [Leptospira santarosai]
IDGKLPNNISIVGLGRSESSNEDFQSKIEHSIHAFSRRAVQPSGLQDFLSKFRYCAFDATHDESYGHLHELI